MHFNKMKYYQDYKIFTHKYKYGGEDKTRRYMVMKDGTILNESTERPLKKLIREKTLVDGSKLIQVQVRLPQKFYNYSRVVAAAYYPFFDIDDPNQVIRHRNGKVMDFRPINLYVTERATHTKYLTEIQQRAIRWIREHEAGLFGRKPSYRMLAKLYGVSKDTIQKVIRGTY
jgi:hypothetical protein